MYSIPMEASPLRPVLLRARPAFARRAPEELKLVVRQPRPPRYGARERNQGRRSRVHEAVDSRLEHDPEYQRLLACLVELSGQLQRSLTREQLLTWLELEDTLSDHAWLLCSHYFAAGYEFGKARRHRQSRATATGTVRTKATTSDASGAEVAAYYRAQAVLLRALAQGIASLSQKKSHKK